MRTISVLVPTANQPEFLHAALQSIARQTAAPYIGEVLVAENLLNRESEAVCRRFKDLPIQYIYHDPPLAPAENFNCLFNKARGDLVAVLCDDDWWAPGHLTEAAADLDHHSQAVARFSSCINVESLRQWTGEMSRSSVLWLAAGEPDCRETWSLDKTQVLAAAWIPTPFHASSMVVQRQGLQSLVPSLHEAHIYQNDRILQVLLSLQGTIVYEPSPDTFIRAHAGAATHLIPQRERQQVFRDCTENIEQLSVKAGVDLIQVWHTAFLKADEPALEGAARYFRMALDDRKLRACGFDHLISPPRLMRILRKIRSVAKNRWGSMLLQRAHSSRIPRNW